MTPMKDLTELTGDNFAVKLWGLEKSSGSSEVDFERNRREWSAGLLNDDRADASEPVEESVTFMY